MRVIKTIPVLSIKSDGKYSILIYRTSRLQHLAGKISIRKIYTGQPAY